MCSVTTCHKFCPVIPYRTFYTTHELLRISNSASAHCQRCKTCQGFLHMLRKCSDLEEFCKYVVRLTLIKGKTFQPTYTMQLSRDLQELNVNHNTEFSMLADAVGGKHGLQESTSELPSSQNQWLNKYDRMDFTL